MDTTILIYTILTLAAIGIISAVVLYFVAQKFKVEENPKIEEVNEKLPGVNCGACGMAGCHDLAQHLVETNGQTTAICTVCTSEEWAAVAQLLGIDAIALSPKIAVLRCQGGKLNGIQRVQFEGFSKCSYAHLLHAGENGCAFGCFGFGDCTDVCKFDAIHINPQTALPEVSEQKCTACGMCVTTCPRGIIELRNKNEGNRVFVSCISNDKGAVAAKFCKAACIGCGKCEKVCPSQAIKIENNLSYIDFEKCILCESCVPVCPTKAILSTLKHL